MITTLTQAQILPLYERLCEDMPDKPWLAVVRSRAQDATLTGSQRLILRRSFAVAHGLATLEAHRLDISDVQLWEEVAAAASVIAQLFALAESGGARPLFRRFHGALRKAEAMRALRFELHLAVGLFRQGCEIHWPDESVGPETYDMRVTPPGLPAFELECKSFAVDTGSALPTKESAALLDALSSQLTDALPQQRLGLRVVELQVHQPLPQSGADVQALAHQVSAAVLANQESLPGLCEIRTVELVLPPYADGSPWNASAVGGLVEASTDQLVSRLTVRGNEDRGFLCASITSTMEDRALDRLEATIKKAVKKQLTATRPGCVAVCLEGADGQHLADLAKISTNPLRKLALDVFAAESSKHLACLAFVSLSELQPRSERTWAGISTVYSLDSEEGDFPNSGLAALLAPD